MKRPSLTRTICWADGGRSSKINSLVGKRSGLAPGSARPARMRRRFH